MLFDDDCCWFSFSIEELPPAVVLLFGLPFAIVVNADLDRDMVVLLVFLLPRLFVFFDERMVDPLSPISANNIVTVSNPRTLSCLAKVGLRTLLLFFVDAPPPAPADDDEVAAPARLNPTPPPAPRADPPRFGDKAVPPEIDCRLMVWLAAVTASTNVAPMFEAREDIGAVVLAVVVPVG